MLSLYSNLLWILGASGVVSTLSYLWWYRSIHKQQWHDFWKSPQLQFPLCLSCTLFSSGVAIGTLSSVPDVAWYRTLVWFALAGLFAVQSAVNYMAGSRTGWYASTEGMS